jgi:hypothetical protein
MATTQMVKSGGENHDRLFAFPVLAVRGARGRLDEAAARVPESRPNVRRGLRLPLSTVGRVNALTGILGQCIIGNASAK